MKINTKKTIIVELIILGIVLILLFWWVYNTRQVEKYLPELSENFDIIPKNTRGGVDVAYKLKAENSKIIVTLYYKEDIAKNIITYNIKDDVVSSIHYELHYSTMLAAKMEALKISGDEFKENIEIKDNIVSYYETGSKQIGKTADEIYKTWESSSYLKLD